MTRSISVRAACIALGLAQPAFAQFGQPVPFVSGTIDANDEFGRSIAISGTTVLVGSSQDESGMPPLQTGAVYAFDAITGDELYRVVSPNGNSFDQFGWSLDADGDRFVVGARFVPTNGGLAITGAAYLYELSTGTLLHTFTPDDTAVGQFGEAVAISGDRVIIGASRYAGAQPVGAYVYDAVTGDLIHTLIADDITSFDGFGASVAVDGDLAIIGAPEQTVEGTIFSGAAYVFDIATGGLVTKITALNPASVTRFGREVEIDGTTAYISENRLSVGASATGRVFEFDATTGLSRGSFSRSSGSCGVSADEFEFGSTLVVLESYLAVGVGRAEIPSGSNNQSGAVFVYRRSDRECIGAILPPGGGFPAGRFSSGLAYADGRLVIGAMGNSASGTDAGGAYIIESTLRCPADCDGSGEVDFNDLVQMVVTIGQPVVGDACDPNLDEITTFDDLIQALFQFGPCE